MRFPQHNRVSNWLLKLVFVLLLENFCYAGLSQCPKVVELWDQLRIIENSIEGTTEGKLSRVLRLKKEFEQCKLPLDSVYARILHRIALYDYLINNNSPTARSIEYTLESISINTRKAKGSSVTFAVNSYSNVAKFYRELLLYDKALDYYDSTTLLIKQFPNQFRFILSSKYDRSDIFFHTGDYQQSIDESLAGLLESKKRSDTSWMISFLNQIAQSHFFQNQLPPAIEAADKAIALANSQMYKLRNLVHSGMKPLYFKLATAFKTKAMAYEAMGKDTLARLFFQRAIKNRIISTVDNEYGQVAGDYIDFGNFYLNTAKSLAKANACYFKTLEFAKRGNDKERMAKAYLNLGQSFYRRHNYSLAEDYYLKSLRQITSIPYSNFLQQPTSGVLDLIVNKEYTLWYLRNRMQLLIEKFKNTGDKSSLQKAVQTVYLSDTLFTHIRHQQTGEQSKLYWRSFTRESYALAMEAAYLSNDPTVAFFLMERSRAVVLNEKINELGSFAYLPTNEAVKEQQLRNELIRQQQNATPLPGSHRNSETSQLDLLEAKESFYRYIKSLEKNFPSYYQYKYADAVPSLEDLKRYLSANQQSFVHYFMGDTVTYVLGITGNNIKMLRISKDDFEFRQISELLRFFSDKQLLNNQYSSFASLSYKLNRTLFEPLGLPKGRVVICPDNFLLPFEALSTDAAGSKMLINDYSFSYIYSAGYLLKKFPEYPAKGDFAGFAPVSFRSSLGLPDLNNSAISLSEAAGNYSKVLMYKTTEATKRNFLGNIGNYNIVNVFSHARAEAGDEEPMLYMHDSLIGLSELQYLNKPCTKLVVLSACQTTAGKNATGEGIYSLARGFAAAGIPSVAATIWKADEATTYSISGLFHQYLSRGMRKDEALQKAKLQFMKSADREHLLPYFWANMIIMGDPGSIEISGTLSKTPWIISLLLLIILIMFVYKIVSTKNRTVASNHLRTIINRANYK